MVLFFFNAGHSQTGKYPKSWNGTVARRRGFAEQIREYAGPSFSTDAIQSITIYRFSFFPKMTFFVTQGRLSELLSQMRMQRNQWATTAANEYTLDKDSSEEMKSFLTMQQQAMELLIQTVNKDMKALKIISEGMTQLTRG